MDINIRENRVKALIRRFSNFGRRIGAELRETVRTFTRNVQERARREHKFTTRTGETERSVERRTYQNGDSIEGEVFSRNKIAIFLAKGTRPHIIVPRRKKALRWADNSRFIFAKKVHHPGTKGDPFLEKALEKEQSGIITRFKAAIMRAWGG